MGAQNFVRVHEHSDQFDFDAYLPQILGPGHGSAVDR